MSYIHYFSQEIMEEIVRALIDSHDSNRLAYDPSIGNTPTSFGVSTWQSNMFYLERRLGATVGVEVIRRGNHFHIKLPTCRISIYKFGSRLGSSAADFRLDGQRSKKRSLILENNVISLFNYTMDGNSQPVKVPELVAAYSGNPEDGLLEVHIGAPISSERTQDGWLWLEQVYANDEPGSASISVDNPTPTPRTPTYTHMKAPVVTVEELPGDEKEMPKQ